MSSRTRQSIKFAFIMLASGGSLAEFHERHLVVVEGMHGEGTLSAWGEAILRVQRVDGVPGAWEQFGTTERRDS